MNRKLTIGVQVDAHVEKMLSRALKPFSTFPVRLHASENYHVPILTLGWIHEDALDDAVIALQDIAGKTAPCAIDFLRIAPRWKKRADENNLRKSNALWLYGQESEKLRDLYEQVLSGLGVPHEPVKKFAPHIVLGQMRQKQLVTYEPLPDSASMVIDFPLTLDLGQLTLFEEVQIEGKRVFEPIEEFELTGATE